MAPGRLGVGVAGRAEHGDEDLGTADLAGGRVKNLDGLSGIVDEHLLAGDMALAHDRRQPTAPGAVELAETAETIAIRLGRPVFLPKQPLGHARTLEFAVNDRPVRFAAITLGHRFDEQASLERGIIEFVWNRPANPGKRKATEIVADGGATHAKRFANQAVAHLAGMFEPQ